MDDTLCHYDKSLRLPRCHEFEPRAAELEFALKSQRAGIDVIIATARPSWTAQKTFHWLDQHNLDVSALYVKNRKNWAIAAHDLKVDMLQNIFDVYTVLSFHDDSPFTVAAALDLGVNALLVPGNEEYWTAKGESMGWPPVPVEKLTQRVAQASTQAL
jgi:hypothetical protein